MANPTVNWEKLGDKYYRKINLYTTVFDHDLELNNYIVTGCPYGGAIGMAQFLYSFWLEHVSPHSANQLSVILDVSVIYFGHQKMCKTNSNISEWHPY